MKMKDAEFVKDYSGRLMDVVNRMRLFGKMSRENDGFFAAKI